MKKTWLLRLTEIREELTAMDVPVVDRAVFERLFRVRRRRAIQLLHYFGGYQSGRTFLIDRLALIQRLLPLEASADFAVEQHRRRRLADSLEKVRRARAGAAVVIAFQPPDQLGTVLPEGVDLQCGLLRIEFKGVQQLLCQLYAICREAANDFEAFRSAAEGTGARPAAIHQSGSAATATL